MVKFISFNSCRFHSFPIMAPIFLPFCFCIHIFHRNLQVFAMYSTVCLVALLFVWPVHFPSLGRPHLFFVSDMIFDFFPSLVLGFPSDSHCEKGEKSKKKRKKRKSKMAEWAKCEKSGKKTNEIFSCEEKI